MVDIERPGRWIWEPSSRQGKYAEKLVQGLRAACKNEDDFIEFYQALLASQPDDTETRAILLRLVLAFYSRSSNATEDRQEYKDFRARISGAELESTLLKSSAGIASGKSRQEKAKSQHDKWVDAAQQWLKKHGNPRGVTGAMAKKFSKSDRQMRAVLKAYGVIQEKQS